MMQEIFKKPIVTLHVTVARGPSLEEIVEQVVNIAKNNSCGVTFVFDGCDFKINEYSTPSSVKDDYIEKLRGSR